MCWATYKPEEAGWLRWHAWNASKTGDRICWQHVTDCQTHLRDTSSDGFDMSPLERHLTALHKKLGDLPDSKEIPHYLAILDEMQKGYLS